MVNPGTPSYTPSVSISVTKSLNSPPSKIIFPSSVVQLQCPYLPSVKAWLVTHTPELKVMQVSMVYSPPHKVTPSLV